MFRVAFWVLLVDLASCSGSATSDLVAKDAGSSDVTVGAKDAGHEAAKAPDATAGEASTHVCTPGAQVGCACPGGKATGVQVCDTSGEGYGPCTGCSNPEAGTDAGSGSGSGSWSGSGSGSGSSSSGSGSGSSSGSGSGSSSGSGSGSGSGHLDAGEDSGPPTCADKAPYCGSTTILQTCAVTDGGTTEVPTLCPHACLNGACVACQPGTVAEPNTQCANDTAGYYAAISTCSPEGVWVTQTCSPSTPVCTGSTGTASCGGVCVPGSTECAQEFQPPGVHCQTGKTCLCAVNNIHPGISVCDDTGNWGYAYDCTMGECGGSGASISYCQTVAGQGVCPTPP